MSIADDFVGPPQPDPRDTPEAWLAIDPTMSLADAQWWADNWRGDPRCHPRDGDDPGFGARTRRHGPRPVPAGC